MALPTWTGPSKNTASPLCSPAIRAMQAAYLSGDPYLAFAKQAGAVPSDATKHSHGPQRELFKQCALAVAYGMEAEGLARRIGQPPIVARDLLRAHRETYRRFWAWSDAAVDHAMLTGSITTAFGWPVHVGAECQSALAAELSLPGQRRRNAAPGRLLCHRTGHRGLRADPRRGADCAPLDRLDQDIERMQAAMAKASRIVLEGFELRTEVNVIRYPDRYQDPRGAVMWDRVMRLIAAREGAKQRGVA